MTIFEPDRCECDGDGCDHCCPPCDGPDHYDGDCECRTMGDDSTNGRRHHQFVEVGVFLFTPSDEMWEDFEQDVQSLPTKIGRIQRQGIQWWWITADTVVVHIPGNPLLFVEAGYMQVLIGPGFEEREEWAS